jgi:hypothetical protein
MIDSGVGGCVQFVGKMRINKDLRRVRESVVGGRLAASNERRAQ